MFSGEQYVLAVMETWKLEDTLTGKIRTQIKVEWLVELTEEKNASRLPNRPSVLNDEIFVTPFLMHNLVFIKIPSRN